MAPERNIFILHMLLKRGLTAKHLDDRHQLKLTLDRLLLQLKTFDPNA